MNTKTQYFELLSNLYLCIGYCNHVIKRWRVDACGDWQKGKLLITFG